jgi:hypothetical protein
LYPAWKGKLMVKTHQGKSQHTERKEMEIKGVTSMRFNQFKSQYFKYKEVLCADVFCGTGRNLVDGEIVDGSPIRMIDGWKTANNQKIKTKFWFSDIRQSACDTLHKIIKSRYDYEMPIYKMSAADAVNELGNYLAKNPQTYLCLTLDPNGPKDFPKHELQDMLSAFAKTVDVNTYISPGAMNRQLQARNKAGYQLSSWLHGIENFDTGLVRDLISNGRFGWIRKPIVGDAWRWTMIPTFGIFKPRNAWEKQGFVSLKSQEAKDVIKFYCGELYNAK